MQTLLCAKALARRQKNSPTQFWSKLTPGPALRGQRPGAFHLRTPGFRSGSLRPEYCHLYRQIDNQASYKKDFALRTIQTQTFYNSYIKNKLLKSFVTEVEGVNQKQVWIRSRCGSEVVLFQVANRQSSPIQIRVARPQQLAIIDIAYDYWQTSYYSPRRRLIAYTIVLLPL